ncbi:hypothetical protein IT570_11900 [Candidatus Sumerlaeota bacterium]|nr:hypothetical protein [Candidatus Sumerlaeota bacterium]
MNGEARRRLLSALLILPFCLLLLALFLAPRFAGVATALPCTDSNPLREWWWAGLQVWRFPVAYRMACAMAPLLVLLLPETVFAQAMDGARSLRQRTPAWLEHPFALLTIAALVLWLLRSASLSFGDSQFYVTDLIPRQAESVRGMFLDYNSPGASIVYSLGYRHAKMLFSASPLLWYQVAGIASLLVFLSIVYTYRHRVRMAGPVAMLLLFAGNWSQTTFGAAENYGQVLLCVVAYGILGVEAVAGRAALWKPCLAFAMGAFFHLIIGWLLPSLLLLVVWRWRAEDLNGRLLAIVSLVLPAALTGALCYHLGFDISFMSGGNAAEGKLIPFLGPMDPYSGGPNYHYSTLDPQHLAHIAQVNLLMGWPGIVALVVALPFVSGAAFLRDRATQFLAAVLACALLFNLLWNPDLEMWKDQDLFSLPGVAWCLLGAHLFTGNALAGVTREARLRLLATAIIAGLAWRAPVALYHSVLSENYANPGMLVAPCPFAN